jgi:hypothetical protein
LFRAVVVLNVLYIAQFFPSTISKGMFIPGSGVRIGEQDNLGKAYEKKRNCINYGTSDIGSSSSHANL